MDYFVSQICGKWVEEKHFLKILWILTPSKPNEVKYSHNKCSYRNDIETRK